MNEGRSEHMDHGLLGVASTFHHVGRPVSVFVCWRAACGLMDGASSSVQSGDCAAEWRLVGGRLCRWGVMNGWTVILPLALFFLKRLKRSRSASADQCSQLDLSPLHLVSLHFSTGLPLKLDICVWSNVFLLSLSALLCEAALSQPIIQQVFSCEFWRCVYIWQKN